MARKVEPGNIHDWASQCAERIDGEYDSKSRPRIARIAAIIETFAAPILKLLREAKREHRDCSRSMMIEGDDPEDYPCSCGASAWNARVDAVLAERESP